MINELKDYCKEPKCDDSVRAVGSIMLAGEAQHLIKSL